jgi:AcrR family transcriptional regulator
MNAEQVLDIAMTAYWQSDPADVSVNAICQMAGISKPSLYRAFGSEDGLSRAVLDRYAEQVLSEMFVILHGGMGLRETLDALIDFASDDPRMETGCLFYKMRAGKHRLGPGDAGAGGGDRRSRAGGLCGVPSSCPRFR